MSLSRYNKVPLMNQLLLGRFIGAMFRIDVIIWNKKEMFLLNVHNIAIEIKSQGKINKTLHLWCIIILIIKAI